MKFESYLEAVKTDIYNELFNIDTKKIKMKSIPEFNNFTFDEMYSEISRGKTSEKMLSLSKEQIRFLVLKVAKKYTDILKVAEEEADLFTDAFFKIKEGNYYVDDQTAFVFVVGNKIYELSSNFNNSKPIGITFSELGKEDFKINSIMSSKENSSMLYNKIRGIIEVEVPDWARRIFYFEPKLETKEAKMSDINSDLFFLMPYIIKYFIEGSPDLKSTISTFKKDLKKINLMFQKKSQDLMVSNVKESKGLSDIIKNEIINFINSVFSGLNIPSSPSQELIKISKTKDWNTAKISSLIIGPSNDMGVGSSIVSSNSLRTRIYRIIIKQMFGKKVFIKEKEKYVYFSLKDFNVNKMGGN